MADTIGGDRYWTGQQQFANLIAPANCVGSNNFNGSDPLTTAKQYHRFRVGFAQAHGTAATNERRAVHIAAAAGTIESFKAGPVVAASGDSTVAVDLRKNGTTVLSAVITIDNGKAAYSLTAGTLSVTTYAAGDVLEQVVTSTPGTGTPPQGVFGTAILSENP